MLSYRNASLDDREDFTGMNDFGLHSPPLIADMTISGEAAQVTVALDDNNHLRLEVTLNGQTVLSQTGEEAGLLMIMIEPEMTLMRLILLDQFITYGSCMEW